ncbi:endogenous retrovirus group K member 19 Pol protein-like protein [Turdus rufiventris]|nr:endogenous retrovirus group K member 19 Pol protein-like protein [Turdus rufiventris]
MIWATAATTTNAKASRTHWIQAIAALGKPNVIKTDNAPAYVSNIIKQFFAKWHIKHVTGITYNSTGQAIIERTHQNLKRLLGALKKEGESSPHELVAKACYVLNWLNRRDKNKRLIDHHFVANSNYFTAHPDPVDVYNPQQNLWVGPQDLITWGWGYACVSTGDQVRWVPAKWVRPHFKNSTLTQEETSND